MGLWDCCACGDANDKKLSEMAASLGWDGLCVLAESGGNIVSGPGRGIVRGILIDAKSVPAMKKAAGASRKSALVVAVRGSGDEMNRAALETPDVDILVPDPGTKIDIVMAKMATENGVSIMFVFNPVLHSSVEDRSRVFRQMSKNAVHVRKFRAPFIIASGALSEWDLRSPSELISFGKLLGFDEPAVKKSMSGGILSENEKRLSGRWVMPGVEVEKR
jgi:ribonuclease P/MRP protein subunit RPP1